MGKIAPAKIVLAGIFAMLLAFAPGVYAHAESKVTQVRYEVSATVVYIDGEVQTTQKVPTGTTLKKPQPAGTSDFLGWRDTETGCFWNFDEPVESNLTLGAVYAPSDSGDAGRLAAGLHSKDAQPDEWVVAQSKLQADRAQMLTATSDPFAVMLPALTLVAAACVSAVALACCGFLPGKDQQVRQRRR